MELEREARHPRSSRPPRFARGPPSAAAKGRDGRCPAKGAGQGAAATTSNIIDTPRATSTSRSRSERSLARPPGRGGANHGALRASRACQSQSYTVDRQMRPLQGLPAHRVSSTSSDRNGARTPFPRGATSSARSLKACTPVMIPDADRPRGQARGRRRSDRDGRRSSSTATTARRSSAARSTRT